MAENFVSLGGDQIEIVTTSGGAGVTYQLSAVERTEYQCAECGSTLVVLEGGADDYLQGTEGNCVYVYALVRSCPSMHLMLGIPDHIGGPKIPVVSPQLLDFGTLTQGNTATLQTVVVNTNSGLAINWRADVGGKPWLSLDISHGTIQPGNNQIIMVTANTAGLSLSPPSHTATLTVSSNLGITTTPITLSVV